MKHAVYVFRPEYLCSSSTTVEAKFVFEHTDKCNFFFFLKGHMFLVYIFTGLFRDVTFYVFLCQLTLDPCRADENFVVISNFT